MVIKLSRGNERVDLIILRLLQKEKERNPTGFTFIANDDHPG
jgi:hypothetical protein